MANDEVAHGAPGGSEPGGSEPNATEPAPSGALGNLRHLAPLSLGRQLGAGFGAALLFLLLRILAVSNWDWATARRIMAVTDIDGALTMIFGSLMASEYITGLLVVGLLPPTLLRWVWRLNGTRRLSMTTALMLILLCVTAASMTISLGFWWIPAGIVVMLVALVLLKYHWPDGLNDHLALRVFEVVRVAAAATLLIAAVVSRAPWVPLETIETRSHGALEAYPLKAEAGFLSVLTRHDRKFLVIPTSDIVSRD